MRTVDRPIIAKYRQAQKAAYGMELLQFTEPKAIRVTIALLSVVAMQLLRPRDLPR